MAAFCSSVRFPKDVPTIDGGVSAEVCMYSIVTPSPPKAYCPMDDNSGPKPSTMLMPGHSKKAYSPTEATNGKPLSEGSAVQRANENPPNFVTVGRYTVARDLQP